MYVCVCVYVLTINIYHAQAARTQAWINHARVCKQVACAPNFSRRRNSPRRVELFARDACHEPRSARSTFDEGVRSAISQTHQRGLRARIHWKKVLLLIYGTVKFWMSKICFKKFIYRSFTYLNVNQVDFWEWIDKSILCRWCVRAPQNIFSNKLNLLGEWIGHGTHWNLKYQILNVCRTRVCCVYIILKIN